MVLPGGLFVVLACLLPVLPWGRVAVAGCFFLLAMADLLSQVNEKPPAEAGGSEGSSAQN